MARGKFITLEGGEGAGKSTTLAALADHLRFCGIDVVVTREPGGTSGAEEIRQLLLGGQTNWEPKSEALLHYVARVEHVAKLVQPALDSGKWVLSDRFADSTLAYQGFGHGLDKNWIARLHRFTLGRFRPDLTFILDVPPDIGLVRAASRRDGGNRYERLDPAFHTRVRRGFRWIARHERSRCVIIDAAQDASTVKRKIIKTVERRFGITAE